MNVSFGISRGAALLAPERPLALRPAGRAGSPEELASLIAWLLGPEADRGLDSGFWTIRLPPVQGLHPDRSRERRERAGVTVSA